jgi:hypothetical protein
LTSEQGYRIAVAGVGIALTGFAIASGIAFAGGHEPTQAFWTVATGLAGALIGVIVPTPPTLRGGGVAATARQAHTDAATAAGQAAKTHSAAAQDALAKGDADGAKTAADNAHQAAQAADDHAQAAAKIPKLPVSVTLSLLLLIALACIVVLFIQPTHLTPNLSKELLGFSSAAGGAAIGLLAPSPK